MPDSTKLSAVFGMSETMGTFPSAEAARRFVGTVTRAVGKCEKRTLTLTVKRDDEVRVGGASGRVWQIDSAASERTTFVFRVGLVRVGPIVAEVMFTPSDGYDVEPARYVGLVKRAAQRIAQSQRSD